MIKALSVGVLAVLPGLVAAQGVLPGETFTSLTLQASGSPHPVLGADGRVHLAHEVIIGSPSRLFMTIDKVEAVDPAGTVLATLEGDALAAMMETWSTVDGALVPGGMAVVLLDVPFAADAALPETIATRITATRQMPGPDGKPAPFTMTLPVTADVAFTAAEVPLGDPAIVLDAPLRGDGWLAINGCCDAATSHRAAFQLIDGGLVFPERFAIDWMQLGPDGTLFAGDGSKLEDYPFYGTPVYAVADATVESVQDGLDPQVPLGRNAALTPENITGNDIVLDLGGGRYALYAHLLKGSLQVKPGDKVTAGQPIARLGNTGNSDGPHLHFQVMDGPSPLNSSGLPYVLRSFSTRGYLAGGVDAAFDTAMQGKPPAIDPRGAGAHQNALPLNDQVVDFE